MPELCFPVSLPEFRFGITENRRFSGVALQVQQHEVLFGRVAALQCAVLFALLKRTYLKDEFIKYDLSVLSILAVVRESSVSNSIPP